jgi:DNA gyrase/topoisomerase IV subunit A
MNGILHHYSITLIIPEVIRKDNEIICLRYKCLEPIMLSKEAQELLSGLVISKIMRLDSLILKHELKELLSESTSLDSLIDVEV